jgi:hypothetical protein
VFMQAHPSSKRLARFCHARFCHARFCHDRLYPGATSGGNEVAPPKLDFGHQAAWQSA